MQHRNRRAALHVLAAAVGASALPACSTPMVASRPAQSTDGAEVSAQWDAWIRGRMAKHGRSNLSLAVLDGEQLAWSAGFGMADPARGIAATAQTRYRAGSISKVFTTMAAMQLAERGRLDLDAPLDAALPGFRMRARQDAAPAVTPRHILQHRAGLPTDWGQGMWSDTPETLEQLVARLRDEYLCFPPGQVYAYSNVGFTLLGAAIEQLSATPFAQWMHTQLLAPMGMHDSAFEIAAPSGPQAALPLNARGQAEHEPGLRDMPAGGLNTTVLDLLQLARLWFSQGQIGGHAILAPASLAAMQQPPHPPTATDLATVGLGWHLLDEELDGVGPVLWHSGGTPHHRAELMLLPQLRLAVAAMSSTASAEELVHEAALKALTLWASTRSAAIAPRPLRTGPDPLYPPAPAPAYAGHYDTPIGVVRVEQQGEQLHVDAMGKRARLVRRADGYTQLQYRLLGLIPMPLGRMGEMAFTRHDAAQDQAWLLVRRKGRFTLVGTRLEPVPIPAAWKTRLGRYRYVGGDPFLAAQLGEVRVFEDAGLLLVQADVESQSTSMALAPVNDTEATVRGLGRARGDTIHARQEGGDTVLEYIGMRFQRVAQA